jgi:divalent metal cation (Fe/Co/Zn/Cd) transporter
MTRPEPETSQRPGQQTPPLATDATCSRRGSGPSASPAAPVRDEGWERAARQARSLSWFSLLWMTVEGALGLLAGATAGSIALLGWALGSVIEGVASVIVIWRFTGRRMMSDSSEGRAQKAVAVSFFLLAPYLAVAATRDLATGHHSEASTLGFVVTAASLLVMPVLGIAKKRLALRLESGATKGEGIQNLLCAAQAGAVLAGLTLTATVGWAWVDPAVGLGLAIVALHEGREAWRGDECC